MPELAEVALMAVEVNRHAQHVFHAVARSSIAKLGPDLPLPRCWRTFRLEARSRGKEMRLDVWPVRIDGRLRLQEAKERLRLNEAKQAEAEAEADDQQEDEEEGQDEDEEKGGSSQQRKRKRKPAANGRGKPFTRVHADSPTIPLDGPLPLLFRCGMTGHIQAFPSHTATHKHAHLSFLSSEPSEVSVCFVDQRQFGRWLVTADWDATRGPCPLTEYRAFRKHVLDSLDMRAMHKPLCETLLDQRFFNGIGNYLRAEICHRAQVNPFASARTVLSSLVDAADCTDEPDVLRLCHDVPQEAFTLGYRYGSMNNEVEISRLRAEHEAMAQAEAEEEKGSAEDASSRSARDRLPPPTKLSRKSFASWLRCYEKHDRGMLSTVDGLGRAMWHSSKWRVAGKSKAGSRRPRKGKTISGAEREAGEQDEEDGAAAQDEPAEAASTGKKRKQKGAKKRKQPAPARKAQQDSDEADEPAAVSGRKRGGQRKRARAEPEAESAVDVAAGSKARRRQSGEAAAAAVEVDGDELPEQYRGGVERRRSSRLSAQSAPQEEIAVATEADDEQTAGVKKRVKRTAAPRRAARGSRQHIG